MLNYIGLSLEQCIWECVFSSTTHYDSAVVRKKSRLEQCAWALRWTSQKVKGTVDLGRPREQINSSDFRCYFQNKK